MTMDINLIQEELRNTEANFANALNEFVRQSGYIEGTLDTIIAINVDMNPEVAMSADRLIKTFHSVEGVCTQGLKLEFQKLLSLCEGMCKELQEQKKNPEEQDLDFAIKTIKGIKNRKNTSGK
jgi:hypothetical protein